MMIPEGRLQTLVEQALDRQLERCLYHNVRKPMVSLLSDYQCGREQIPSVVYQVSLLVTRWCSCHHNCIRLNSMYCGAQKMQSKAWLSSQISLLGVVAAAAVCR